MNEFTIFLLKSGIHQNMLFILLALPLAAMLVLFAKEIIGIKSFNLYTTSLGAIALISIGSILGIILFLLIILVDYIVEYFIKDLKLHFASKIAITLSTISLVTIILLALLHIYLGVSINVSPFAIILLILLTENLSFTKINKGIKNGNIIYMETIILSLIIYLILDNSFLETVLFKYPYISIVAIIIDVYIGKTTSLRLREIYRFRNIIKE